MAAVMNQSADMGALTYEELIRQHGAVRDPATGMLVRIVPDGSSTPHKTRDGRWVQASEKRFIALSMEEARNKGMKWDYYATGLHCKQPHCQKSISGWVRGGRKLENEHDHIFVDGYGETPDMIEVTPPSDEDTLAVDGVKE